MHSQACAIEPRSSVRLDIGRLRMSGIDLDREVAVRLGTQVEVPAQRVDELCELSCLEEIRRAASEVELDDLPVAIEEPCSRFDLAREPIYVDLRLPTIARNHAIARAVETGTRAKRNVHIQGQGTRNQLSVALARVFRELSRPESRVELQCGWIGCVARTQAVVLPQQVGVKNGDCVHVADTDPPYRQIP